MKTNIPGPDLKVFITLLALICSLAAAAQLKDAPAASPGSPVNSDYKLLITDKVKTYPGFLLIHQLEDKYYLEIPDSLLGREILAVSRLGRSAADFRSPESSFGYAGDLVSELIFHFEKAAGDKMLIRMKSYKERASDTSANGMGPSLARNNSQALIQRFSIRAVNVPGRSSVIELSDYLNQDNPLFGFSQQIKTASGLGAMVSDRSYVDSLQAYPDQLLFRLVRTYNRPLSKTNPALAPFTFELNSSMILLPGQMMAARQADRRVPFRQVDYIDFDHNPLGVANLGYICRWRLEPADLGAYLQGRPSLPKSPIKMYLDAQIPKKWLGYIRDGILSWNRAFEDAGFLNAIEVVMPGTSDGAGPQQRSGVVFKPGKGDQWGNVICDPRTGEILQAQLNFYLDELGSLYRQYLIQAGPLDPAGRGPVLSTELMGRLLTARIAQQMGRALGLKSNAGASAALPLTNLRSNSWLDGHAFNGSITDGALINYLAQPQDGIGAKNLVARVSESDNWTINWGYRLFGGDERQTLDRLIARRTGSGLQLYAGEAAAENTRPATDPRVQSGDLGDDAIEGGKLGIANLKRVVPNVLSWTGGSPQEYQLARDVYRAVVAQYGSYLRYAAGEIGGVYIDSKNSDQAGDVYRFVPVLKQRRALEFIQQEGFKTPLWLKAPAIYQRSGDDFDLVAKVQKSLLADLLEAGTLSKFITAEHSGGKTYPAAVFLADLAKGIFSEITNLQPIDIHRRELQKCYVNKLLLLLQTMAKSDADLPSVLRAHAGMLMDRLKSAGRAYKGIGASHCQDLYERLDLGLHYPLQGEKNMVNPFINAR